METKILNVLKKDVEIITSKLGNNIDKVGVFGSVVQKGIENANDIDLAVFVKDISFEKAKSIISDLKLSKPILTSLMNGFYIKHEDPKPKNCFHIIILNSENPNKKFMELNKDKIFYID